MRIAPISEEKKQQIRDLYPIHGTVETAKLCGVNVDTVRKYRNEKIESQPFVSENAKKGYDSGSLGEEYTKTNTPVVDLGKFRAPDPDHFGRLINPKLPERILVIPDLQAPFHAPEALAFLSMVAQRYQVDEVVCIGDEMDFGWASNYEKYPEIDAPMRELEQGVEFMGELFKMFPKAYALTSNHVHGRLSTMRKNGRIPPQLIHNFREIVAAPRTWEWYEEVHLGHILFRHGDKWPTLNTMQVAREIPRDYGRHMCVVHGHLHTKHGRVGDAVLVGDDEYWAAYTGCLINPRSKAFDYTKAPKVRLGCLVIDKGEVHRIPFRRDDKGQWTGRL